MMKFPFESNNFERDEVFKPESYENVDIEQILPLFLDVKRNRSIDKIIYNMVKELSTYPTFVNVNLAHESYCTLIRELLIGCSELFDDTKSLVLLSLYFKFERILVIMDKIAGNLDEGRKKSCRSRIKNILKKSKYQNNLLIYAEYGLIEYEMDGRSTHFQKIFQMTLENYDPEAEDDFNHLVCSYADVLLNENRKKDCLTLLTKLVLSPKEIRICPDECEFVVPDATKLVVLQKLNERVKHMISSELKRDRFNLEDYFRTSRIVNYVRPLIYYSALIKTKKDFMGWLKKLLKMFEEDSNDKSSIYTKEKVYEIALQMLAYTRDEHSNSDIFEQAIEGYPANMTIIKCFVFSESIPWLRMRRVLGKNLSTTSVLLLIASGQIRTLSLLRDCSTSDCSQIDGNEDVYRTRVINLLKTATTKTSILRHNSLLWRIYLRELFNQPNQNVLDKCKTALYEALDNCPFSKVLYLDGSFFVPGELSQLLDLILEKQLRIHAIPEELSILRSE
jgi:hypothetical protein